MQCPENGWRLERKDNFAFQVPADSFLTRICKWNSVCALVISIEIETLPLSPCPVARSGAAWSRQTKERFYTIKLNKHGSRT